MNIVKHFDSNEFAIKKSVNAGVTNKNDLEDTSRNFWIWALCNNGDLWFRGKFYGKDFTNPYWYQFDEFSEEVGITFAEMRKVIKRLGHLLVLL